MVWQYRVPWAIPNAGPSVSTFHFSDFGAEPDATVAAAVKALFEVAADFIPNDVTISYASEFTKIDTATGVLTDAVSITAPSGTTGGGAGTWAAGAGFRLQWRTGVIRNGYRVRGATFFVPSTSNAFQAGGQVSATVANAMEPAGQAFLTALFNASIPLVIYSRPRSGVPGSQSPVDTADVTGLAATLRGRKY